MGQIGGGGQWLHPQLLIFLYAVELGNQSDPSKWLSAPWYWLSAREERYL